jgi:hypothetical protein
MRYMLIPKMIITAGAMIQSGIGKVMFSVIDIILVNVLVAFSSSVRVRVFRIG